MRNTKSKIIKDGLWDFLNDLGAKKSAPGGGSASALSGALGISLLQMVANFSLSNDQQILKILQKASKIKKDLIELTEQDAQAVSVFFQKGNSCLEKRKAKQMMQETSLRICQNCEKGLKLIPFLLKKGNKNLVSDLKIARLLLKTGLKGAKELSRK